MPGDFSLHGINEGPRPCMQKLTVYLSRLDWAAAFGTLAWSLYVRSGWGLALGLLALVGAWYNPGARLGTWLTQRMFASQRKKNRDQALAAAQPDALRELVARMEAEQAESPRVEAHEGTSARPLERRPAPAPAFHIAGRRASARELNLYVAPERRSAQRY